MEDFRSSSTSTRGPANPAEGVITRLKRFVSVGVELTFVPSVNREVDARQEAFSMPSEVYIAGLTGGIASGKSTVTQIFRGLGGYVVDADVWARRVVEPGSEGLQEIVESFGMGVLTKRQELDRKALGQLIFSDAAARERLNAITHPRVRAGMQSETDDYAHRHPGEPVIWDVPLLFEGDTHRLVQRTVFVYVTAATQLARLMARDGIDEASAKARIAAQWPMDDKKRLATYVIDNEGSLEITREQVKTVWATIREEARKRGSSSSNEGR